jgi:hypothetical protein
VSTFTNGLNAINDINIVVNKRLGFGGAYLLSQAGNIIDQLNGTSAQKFRIWGTNTGSKYLELGHDGTDAVLNSSAGKLRAAIPFGIASYTVGTVPTASLWGQSLIYVSNESGGATVAFSDGTNWKRVTDNATIS